MNPLVAEFRKTILQLAVEGKLVPQDSNDEPASELIKKINIEKERLIKEGKIKRSKPLPPITDDEKPFEIPESWEWVRLGDVGALETGNRPKGGAVASGIPSVSGEHIQASGQFYWEKIKYVPDAFYQSMKKGIIHKEDILIVKDGATTGKTAFVDDLFPFDRAAVNEHTFLLRSNKHIDSSFLFYFLSSVYGKAMILEDFKGMAQGGITQKIKDIVNTPLPPLPEQKRISAKVGELMALCDQLEQKNQELLDVVDKLQATILQLAVEGKLVPQDSNDEPASELIKKINIEKERLIKEGKIKRSKPLPPITDDEKPFEIPESWEWVRLGDVGRMVRGVTFPGVAKKREKTLNSIACLRSTNVQKETTWDDLIYIHKQFVKRKEQYSFEGDILISLSNSKDLVGKVSYINQIIEEATFGTFLATIRCLPRVCTKYIYYVLSSTYVQAVFTVTSSQTTNIANLSAASVNNSLVALPPLPEQERIVHKVQQTLSLCDRLVVPT